MRPFALSDDKTKQRLLPSDDWFSILIKYTETQSAQHPIRPSLCNQIDRFGPMLRTFIVLTETRHADCVVGNQNHLFLLMQDRQFQLVCNFID